MQTEQELVDAALLRYAQRAAARWGAERFRRELERRELEERWIEASRSNRTPYTPVEAPTGTSVPLGPVDASAADRAIGPAPALRFERPAYARHASVPRPPKEEPVAVARRRRLRRKATEPAPSDPARFISPAEAARMSAAGRRLYGLDEAGARR